MQISSGYSVAAGSVDITPQTAIPLAGYATLRKPTFERVATPLEANVIILRSDTKALVLVGFDLMYVGAYLHDSLVQALSGRVPAEALFTTAIHTHSAPPTEDSLPILGAVTPAYRDWLAKQVTGLVLRLLHGPFLPVSIEYHEGSAAQSVNRRKRAFGVSRAYPFVGRHVRIAPNPSGPRDDSIRMLCIRDAAGKHVAMCWSYACHPVGFPILDEVSADYPGLVRSMIRASLGGIPVIFWQGFSGNVSPLHPARNSADSGAPCTLRATDLRDWHDWGDALGRQVLATASARANAIQEPIRCSVRALPLHELGLRSSKRLQLQEIRLGADLVVCGLNAEVAVEYVPVLRELYAPATVIPVGCVGDVFGYLPVDAMVREGGYEARGFVRRFGLRGRFAANVTQIVSERLLRS